MAEASDVVIGILIVVMLLAWMVLYTIETVIGPKR